MKAPIWTRLPWYVRHMFWDFDLKKHQEQRRREREVDAPMRALRLAPEFVELWTNVVPDASTIVVLVLPLGRCQSSMAGAGCRRPSR